MAKEYEKLILSISDIHLGAGEYVNGQKNVYEDFFRDQDLIDFFVYHGGDRYKETEVEVIINGDFLDFISVPYVEFFDDEFWSEESSIQKLQLIYEGHKKIFESMNDFLEKDQKKITYVIGNHDAEIILEGVRKKLLSFFSPKALKNFKIHWENEPYSPNVGIYFQHGHQYEKAHQFDSKKSILKSSDDKTYFIPPWGTYYCYHVLNKYKPERNHINKISPIRTYLIHGLIYDTLFTARFIAANIYYFAMMRFWSLYLSKLQFRKIIQDARKELVMFENYEKVTRKFFRSYQKAKILITGHTHHARYRLYQDGTVFINTGTWNKVINVDSVATNRGYQLTYAKLKLKKKDYLIEDFEANTKSDLLQWMGVSNLPYKVYNA